MTSTPSRNYQRLAERARARRIELGLAITTVAANAGVNKATYRRVEDGQPLRDLNYASIETALGWEPGTCIAILLGKAGERSTTAAQRLGIAEEDISSAIVTGIVEATDLPAPQIRAIRDGAIADLKKRGLL
jgi:DNA-binding XRE family transcriptional regulator